MIDQQNTIPNILDVESLKLQVVEAVRKPVCQSTVHEMTDKKGPRNSDLQKS